ncbi:MAG: adenylate kinase [Clostridia bacterium]|nr:adenylate kinase [Clostridia bacterium]
MKRVVVIGCPGSGKSTLTRELNRITGIPLYHLDMMYWNSDKTTVDKAVFHARLAEVLGRETWIIDGNYASTMEMRIEACDTVIFLDYPTDLCLAGIRARQGKPRADMPWIEDGDDEEFLAFVKAYQEESRPRVLRLLAQNCHKQIHIFAARSEADAFLRSLR